MTRQPKKGAFPRLSLTAAIKIIKEANQIKGKIARSTFAQFGARETKNHSSTSGAFNDKVNALRFFGLITIDNENIELTDLAIKIIDPIKPEEVEKALLLCFNNVEIFKELYKKLTIEAPVSLTVLHEQAVNSLEVNRNQRKKFVDLFINAAERVGLITRIDKNTIKRKAQTLLEQYCVAPNEGLNWPPIPSSSEKTTEYEQKQKTTNTDEKMNSYPYTDKGSGWQLKIEIISNQNITQEIRNIRNKLGELLEKLNNVEKAV